MAEVLDPQTRVDDLFFIAENLIDTLEKENAALERNQLGVVLELAEQKERLSRAYEVRVYGLQQSDAPFEGVDPEQMQELRELSTRLEDLVETNSRVLNVELQASRRFMDVLAQSVQAASVTTGAYGSNGAADAASAAPNAKRTAIAIDENL